MTRVWVLVADSSAAEIYSAPHLHGQLTLVEKLSHDESRLRSGQLYADAPGRVHDRFGPGRHSMDVRDHLRDEEHHRFARQLNSRLSTAQRQGRYERLVVMASPAFLGVLRETMDKGVSGALELEVPKNLVGHDPQAVADHIP